MIKLACGLWEQARLREVERCILNKGSAHSRAGIPDHIKMRKASWLHSSLSPSWLDTLRPPSAAMPSIWRGAELCHLEPWPKIHPSFPIPHQTRVSATTITKKCPIFLEDFRGVDRLSYRTYSENGQAVHLTPMSLFPSLTPVSSNSRHYSCKYSNWLSCNAINLCVPDFGQVPSILRPGQQRLGRARI